MVESHPRDDGQKRKGNGCPAMGGVFFLPLFPSPKLHAKNGCPNQTNPLLSTPPGQVTISTIASPPSKRMKELMEGLNAPGDSGNPTSPPNWLDKKLFNRGRQFYKRYLFCLSFADLLSLILVSFSSPRALNPLIFTGRSDTTEKALQRYISTLLHIMTWYTGDVWDPNDPAHKDVISIRSLHNKMAHLCNSSYNNERVTKVKVAERGYEETENPLYLSIQQDMEPMAENCLDWQSVSSPPVYINQMDMSLTQYAFMGLIVAHPKGLGAGVATEEELESLIHFWRGIGWLLGIEDKYNFCNGNLAETRALCLEVERLLAIPALASADWNYEHMSTCLINGIGTIVPAMSFPATFRYLADLMEVPIPDFASRMSFIHTVHYWTIRLIFALILVIPSLVLLLNRIFEEVIEKVQKQSPKSFCNRKIGFRKNEYT